MFNVTFTTGDVVTHNLVLHYCIMSYHYTSYYFNKFHQKIKKNSPFGQKQAFSASLKLTGKSTEASMLTWIAVQIRTFGRRPFNIKNFFFDNPKLRKRVGKQFLILEIKYKCRFIEFI